MGGLPFLVVAFLSNVETILRPLCGAASFQHISDVFGLDLIHYIPLWLQSWSILWFLFCLLPDRWFYGVNLRAHVACLGQCHEEDLGMFKGTNPEETMMSEIALCLVLAGTRQTWCTVLPVLLFESVQAHPRTICRHCLVERYQERSKAELGNWWAAGFWIPVMHKQKPRLR